MPPKRKSEEASTKTIPLPKKIVFALNGNLLNQREWPVECRPQIAALLSREDRYRSMGIGPRDGVCNLSGGSGADADDDGGWQEDIPLRVQNAAIKWFGTNIWRLSEVSPRRLVKITDLMMIHHQAEQAAQRSACTYESGALEEDLEQFLLPQAGDLPLPPEVRAIFVSPREPSSISKRARRDRSWRTPTSIRATERQVGLRTDGSNELGSAMDDILAAHRTCHVRTRDRF